MEDYNVYVKVGKKYKPIGYWFSGRNDWLSKGVWLVTERPSCKGIMNGEYAKSVFGIDKISDMKEISYADLAALSLKADEILSEIDRDTWHTMSMYEQVAHLLGIIEKHKDDKHE